MSKQTVQKSKKNKTWATGKTKPKETCVSLTLHCTLYFFLLLLSIKYFTIPSCKTIKRTIQCPCFFLVCICDQWERNQIWPKSSLITLTFLLHNLIVSYISNPFMTVVFNLVIDYSLLFYCFYSLAAAKISPVTQNYGFIRISHNSVMT